MNENALIQYYTLIKSKIALGSIKTALEFTDKLLYSYPRDSYAYYFKGNCFFALESYETSIKYFITALKLNPAFAKAYFNLGVSYFMIQKKDAALINIGKALVLFVKSNENEKKLRCINALRFIGGEDVI